jgi:ubiquinone/menaquinone biosynthesis C-methylase UbiE
MAEDFRSFERRGWEKVAQAYARAFTDVTGATTRSLLESVRLASGARLLDVATGTGLVAREALRRGARAVGLDFSSSMTRLARAAVPGLQVVQGDAVALPFSPGAFDAAVTNFGLLHFAHPERAVKELARVTRRGGRVALTVWGTPEENVFFGSVYRAIEKHAKKPDVPAGPAFFRFSDRAELVRLLEGAGLTDARAEAVSWRSSVPDARAFLAIFSEASVRTAAILAAQDAPTMERILAAVASELEAFRGEGGLSVPVLAVLGSATKP